MNFRRSSSSASRDDGASGGSGPGSSSGGGRPLSRWLSKTNALLEQITNAPGARAGEWAEEEARAEVEAERVRCRKCGVVFADKSTLKQHYVLFPKHNPEWSDKDPEFPASPPSPETRRFSTPPRSTSGRSFSLDSSLDDDDQDADHDDRDESLLQNSPLQSNEERTRFASQFSKLHPNFYERDVVVRQGVEAERKAGGLGAKILIGPGAGMNYNPHAKPQPASGSSHARTHSLSASGGTSRPGPSTSGPSSHGRSYSVDTGTTNHALIGFEDDFVGHGAVKRTPHLERSATEPAIHFDSIEEHDDEDRAAHEREDDDDNDDEYDYRSPDSEGEDAYGDESEEERDNTRREHNRSGSSAPTTPPLESQRRDSIESDDTFLATPAQATTDLGRPDDGGSLAHPPSAVLDDTSAHGRAARGIDALRLDDQASTAPSEFDLAFEEAGLSAFPASKPGAAPTAAAHASAARKVPRPAPAVPPPSKISSLASRPAPPPPPPGSTAASSLANRRPPAPPPAAAAPARAQPLPPAATQGHAAEDESAENTMAGSGAGATVPAVQPKKKKAPPPPPPPRRAAASAVAK